MTADQPTLTDDEREALWSWLSHHGVLSIVAHRDVAGWAERTISRRTESLAAENAALGGRLARVEALADEWEADRGILSPDSRYTRDVLLRELRDALAADADTDGGA